MTKVEKRLQALSKAADAKLAHDDNVAKKLGFINSQEAFNKIGNEFIIKAKKHSPSINSVMREYDNNANT